VQIKISIILKIGYKVGRFYRNLSLSYPKFGGKRQNNLKKFGGKRECAYICHKNKSLWKIVPFSLKERCMTGCSVGKQSVTEPQLCSYKAHAVWVNPL
jgi:hypothetical protein